MRNEYVKIFVFVPTCSMKRKIDGRRFRNPLKEILKVIDDMKNKGVAVIGNYDNVSFTFKKGKSRYRAIPGSSAVPTKGKPGKLHIENEVVVCFTANKDCLSELIKALKDNHPYETPVIDVFELVRHDFDAMC